MDKRILTTALWLLALPVIAEEVRLEDVSFVSARVELSGSLALPSAQQPRAAIVFVHGSGPQTRNLALAKAFAARGIAALVYDKRGVGESGGRYEGDQSVSEKNIALLAADTNAAMEALHAHPELEGVPLGLAGISQAGWIVPLAAEQSELARFILLWSGPVCKVSEEDIFSKYTADADGEKVPSYAEAVEARRTPYVWPEFLGKDTDPVDSLRKLDIPGLWIFGGEDGSIPVDLSIERLEGLRSNGHAYEYVLFSGQGHNNIPETFATATQWIIKAAASPN